MAAGALFLAAAVAQAGTISSSSTTSGYVTSTGQSSSFVFAYADNNQGIVEFDVSGIGSQVQSATLDLTPYYAGSAAELGVYSYEGDGSVTSASDFGAGTLVTSYVPVSNVTSSLDITSELNALLSGGATWAGFRLSFTTPTGYRDVAMTGSAQTITYTASVVPLPPAAWMGLGLLGGIGLIGRLRKRRSA